MTGQRAKACPSEFGGTADQPMIADLANDAEKPLAFDAKPYALRRAIPGMSRRTRCDHSATGG
ncbi:MAG: hypothetical protein M3447_03655 [Acidobacteriota bacterium]|nr:hypothetical protein [Acidobacteriota bacterium]